MVSEPQSRPIAILFSAFQIGNVLGILVANEMPSRSFHFPKLNKTDESRPDERVLLGNGPLIERQKMID
jgi:hypothetical protein